MAFQFTLYNLTLDGIERSNQGQLMVYKTNKGK